MAQIRPTSDVQALWNELSALPYAASLSRATLRPSTIGECVDTVAALSAILRQHAATCADVLAERDQLRRDVESVRRVFGVQA